MFNPSFTTVLNSHYLYSKNKPGTLSSSSDNLDDKDELKSIEDDENADEISKQNFELRKNSVPNFFNLIDKLNDKLNDKN